MSLLAELKRRNVIKVALFYAVSSWLVLQVADVLFGLLTVPDWTLKFVLGLLLLGFPFVLVFSWVYEMTPEGVKREKDIDRSQSITDDTGRKLNLTISGALVLAVGLLAYQQFSAGPPDSGSADAAAPVAQQNPAAEPELASSIGDLPSVAVLPFANMSSDLEQGYFSDGLSDTLIHVLAQVSGIKVAARTSSFAYKGQNTDVREIARELGVSTILEGSVQKAGGKLRIIAQLIDAVDGSHLWSKTFDRNDEDIFSIQDEISREVVIALKGALLSSDDANIAQRYQPTLEAYNEFIKGREKMALRTSDNLQAAEKHFRQALRHDPNYALAMVNLGDVLNLQVEHGDLTLEQIKDEAEALFRKALALEPEMGEALTSLASIASGLRRFDEAEALFQRAIELNPNYSTSYHWYSLLLNERGRTQEAMAMMDKAAVLDPLSDIIRVNLVGYEIDRNQPENARKMAREGLARNPGFVGYYGMLAGLEASGGSIAEGLRWATLLQEKDSGKIRNRTYVCQLLAQFPDQAEARSCIDSVGSDYPGHPAAIRMTLLQAMRQGQFDKATAMSERALESIPVGGAAADLKSFLAVLYLHAGKADAARILLVELNPELFEVTGPTVHKRNYGAALLLAQMYQLMGQDKAADLLLERVMALIEGADRRYGLSIGVADAHVHALRGNSELALAAINSAVEEGWRNWWWWDFDFEPALEPLRDHPEFKRLAAVVQADMTRQQELWRQTSSVPPVL